MIKKHELPRAATSKLRLPTKISFACQLLPNGMAYLFQHTELGALGCISVADTQTGETSVLCEVAGNEDDPMYAQRCEMLDAMMQEVMRALESIGGPGHVT